MSRTPPGRGEQEGTAPPVEAGPLECRSSDAHVGECVIFSDL
jgi:hypothetical protein